MGDNSPQSITTNTGTSRSIKYAYKQVPPFNPTYFHAWAMDVEQAFAERRWTKYLLPPTTEIPHDPDITTQSTAFLSQSIPYEHKSAIRQCKSAHEIWRIFNERYASKTREDEVRLEAQCKVLGKSTLYTEFWVEFLGFWVLGFLGASLGRTGLNSDSELLLKRVSKGPFYTKFQAPCLIIVHC